MEFIKLFEPITIHRLRIANRYVMPAMGLHFSENYDFSERYQHFYRERAHGGVGLMIIGPLAIDRTGGAPFIPGLFEDRQMDGFRDFVTELHRNTPVKLGAQLFHMGRNAPTVFFTGMPAIAPSPIKSRLTGQVPREMNRPDIEAVKEAFSQGAKRAKAAGFDLVEIIACTGYLISQFLSPITNHRTDEYGGALENRMRFGLEVIKKVREAVGNDLAIGIRVSGNDFMEGGLTNPDVSLFCAEAEKAGIHAVNVTGGWHETNVPQLTSDVPPGAYAYLARGIKDRVGIPVFASNRLGDPVMAEKVLRSGAADMICVARPLLADPELPRKVKEGRVDEIIRCVACNQGCFDGLFSGTGVTCVLNPRTGREGEIQMQKAEVSKKIFVAGGGPAGMAFALTAAGRGHDVTLFEKEDRLGGQIHLAAAIPGKKEFQNITRSLESRMRRAGVTVRRKAKLTAAKIKRSAPDAVVVATGAEPVEITVPGMDKPHVVNAWDVLKGQVPEVGQRVVIVGGNAVGCETAEYIASEGRPDPEVFTFLAYHRAENSGQMQALLYGNRRKITVIDIMERLADNAGRSSRWVLMKNLRLAGVELRPGTKLVEITDDAVIVETAQGRESVIADTVIMAVGSKSLNHLAGEAGMAGVETVVIGDAKSPRKIAEAIREGFEEALKI